MEQSNKLKQDTFETKLDDYLFQGVVKVEPNFVTMLINSLLSKKGTRKTNKNFTKIEYSTYESIIETLFSSCKGYTIKNLGDSNRSIDFVISRGKENIGLQVKSFTSGSKVAKSYEMAGLITEYQKNTNKIFATLPLHKKLEFVCSYFNERWEEDNRDYALTKREFLYIEKCYDGRLRLYYEDCKTLTSDLLIFNNIDKSTLKKKPYSDNFSFDFNGETYTFRNHSSILYRTLNHMQLFKQGYNSNLQTDKEIAYDIVSEQIQKYGTIYSKKKIVDNKPILLDNRTLKQKFKDSYREGLDAVIKIISNNEINLNSKQKKSTTSKKDDSVLNYVKTKEGIVLINGTKISINSKLYNLLLKNNSITSKGYLTKQLTFPSISDAKDYLF